jgi:hypothetical protein
LSGFKKWRGVKEHAVPMDREATKQREGEEAKKRDTWYIVHFLDSYRDLDFLYPDLSRFIIDFSLVFLRPPTITIHH